MKPPEEPQGTIAVGTVVLIASEYLGRGENEQLSRLLMQSFLNTLASLTQCPETIVCVNSGVRLVGGDPLIVELLRRIEAKGTEILACGTCLSRFDLMDKVAVGQVSDMHTIADTLLRAQKVVPL